MFSTLVSKNEGDNALENAYDQERLFSALVIRWETIQDGANVNRYSVMKNAEQLYGLVEKTPGTIFHEVIYTQRPQRIFFDVDCMRSKLEAVGYAIEEFESALKTTVVEVVNRLFLSQLKRAVEESDLFVVNSSGETGADFKYSYHVLVSPLLLSVENGEINKAIGTQVRMEVEAKLPGAGEFVDVGVYANRHPLRVALTQKGNRKLNLPAKFKRISARKHLFALSLVTNVDDSFLHLKLELPEIESRAQGLLSDAVDDTVRGQILRFLLDKNKALLSAFRLRDNETRGGVFSFDRVTPSYCHICKRDHQKEGIFVNFEISQTQVRYFMHCRRHPGYSVRLKDAMNGDFVGLFFKQALSVVEEMRAEEKEIAAAFNPKHVKHVSADLVPEFELHSTMYVRSGMGTGKTVQLIQFIKRHFAGKRVLFVSFRRTFTFELIGKLNEKLGEGFNFISYRDVEGVLDAPNIVVQFESLHRLQPELVFDLVVLDESESIIAQSTSGLGTDVRGAISAFQRSVSQAKFVLSLDANLSMRTYNIVSQLRQETDQHLLVNTRRKNERDVVVFQKKHQILSQIRNAVEAGRRVVVCTNSLEASQEVANLVQTEFPEKRTLLYNSKSDSRAKTFDLSCPNERMLADVLVYSPTITAGVSIEVDHYDEVFCIFTSASSNADVCAQMVGRVRALRLNRVSIFCDFVPQQKEMVGDKIIDEVNKIMQSIYKHDIFESFYLKLWKENKVVDNKSDNNFLARLLSLLAIRGEPAPFESTETPQEEKKSKGEVRKNAIITKEKLAQQLMSAQTIDDDQFEEIRLRMQKDQDLSLDERLQYDKHVFKRTFMVADEELTTKFIVDHSGARAKAVVKNVKKVLPLRSIGTVDEASLRLKEETQFQADRRTTRVDQAQLQPDAAIDLSKRDIQTLRDETSHVLAVQTLNLIGLIHPFDERHIPMEQFKRTVETSKALRDKVRDLCTILGCKLYAKPEKMLDSINNALYALYGCKLKEYDSDLRLKHKKIVLEFIERKEKLEAQAC